MLILSSTNDHVQVVTSATSGSGYAVEVYASWVDNAAGALAYDRANTATITTATTTDVVDSPAGSTQRNVKSLSIRNDHATDSCLVEVRHNDNTVATTLWKGTLLAGEMVILDEDGEWHRLGATGKALGAHSIVKVENWTSSGTSTVPSDATHVIPSGVGGGGGGGGGGERGASGANAGSAGGGSPLVTMPPIAVTPGASHTVTIGAGGTAGVGNTAGSNGTDGGDGGGLHLRLAGDLLRCSKGPWWKCGRAAEHDDSPDGGLVLAPARAPDPRRRQPLVSARRRGRPFGHRSWRLRSGRDAVYVWLRGRDWRHRRRQLHWRRRRRRRRIRRRWRRR